MTCNLTTGNKAGTGMGTMRTQQKCKARNEPRSLRPTDLPKGCQGHPVRKEWPFQKMVLRWRKDCL